MTISNHVAEACCVVAVWVQSACLQPVCVSECLHVPPPHPAPLRDEQMDTVGGGGSSLARHRETKERRKDFSVLSPSFLSSTRHQAVPPKCQTNRWNWGVTLVTVARCMEQPGRQRWHCVQEKRQKGCTGVTNVICRWCYDGGAFLFLITFKLLCMLSLKREKPQLIWHQKHVQWCTVLPLCKRFYGSGTNRTNVNWMFDRI